MAVDQARHKATTLLSIERIVNDIVEGFSYGHISPYSLGRFELAQDIHDIINGVERPTRREE